MALPMLAVKTFEVRQPSNDQKIRLRPFLVAEEKLLLQSASGTPNEVTDAVKQILERCVQGETDFDAENLPSFDLEFLFLKLRAESVGSKVDLLLPHPDSEECDRTEVQLNLQEVKVQFNKDHDKKIMLDKNIGVIMRYPTMRMIANLGDADMNETEASFALLENCIETVFTKDGETHAFGDADKEEKEQFIDSMSTDQFMKLQEFFTGMPALKHTIHLKRCVTCGQPFDYEVSGLQSFF